MACEEAWTLLADRGVGRIGLSIGAMPAIFPVEYTVVDDTVVLRTSAGSRIAAAASGAVVAFEVDDHERLHPSGWSVLMVGRAEVVHDSDLAGSVVRIRPEFVSGRRQAVRKPGASGTFGPVDLCSQQRPLN